MNLITQTHIKVVVFALTALLLIAVISGCTGALKKRVIELEQQTATQEGEINTLERRIADVDAGDEAFTAEVDYRLARLEAGPEGMELASTHEVHFELNKHELSTEAKLVLDQVAGELKARPNSIVELIGQTDALGTEDYNFWLGERRAEEARRYLREKFGIPLTRLQSASYGELGSRKLTETEQRSGNRQDRQVQLRLWDRPESQEQPEKSPEEDIS
jgi:outer membrane protein OmpA-like peptidoglycan-associated protein